MKNFLAMGFMNLEEAIRMYAFKEDKKKEQFLRTQKEVIAKAESLDEVKLQEQKKRAEQLERDQELLRAAYKTQRFPVDVRNIQSGYRGEVRAQYATASLVTSMVYPSSVSVPGLSWTTTDSNQTLREQLEAEYKIKLKEEVERLKKEMKGDSGQQVEVELLGQGRKFKLDGE